MAVKWFKPKKETGWDKDQSPTTRRRKLMASTPKSMSLRTRHIQAGRRANALANVTRDHSTEAKARADANYFFNMAKKEK